jgi:hypothetical protein
VICGLCFMFTVPQRQSFSRCSVVVRCNTELPTGSECPVPRAGSRVARLIVAAAPNTGVSLAIGPKFFLITFKVIDVI